MTGLFIIWLLAVLLTVRVADRKGRTGAAGFQRFHRRGLWGMYAILLAPVALVHVLILKPDRRALDRRAELANEWPECPACRSQHHPLATICAHCLTPLTKP